MTKTRLLRSRVGRHYIANFDVAIRDNDTIDQQLDELPFLRKRCRGQAVLNTVAELLDVPGQSGGHCPHLWRLARPLSGMTESRHGRSVAYNPI